MVVEETWGVPIERAEDFFLAQEDVITQENGFAFRSCQITLNVLEPGLSGKIPFPRTLLRIQGPNEEVKIIRRRFLIQFLTAGG